MGRYPATPLADKEAWMREQQRKRPGKEARRGPVAVLPVERRSEPPQQHQMLRVKQVAAILGVSVQTVHRWFRKRAVIIQGRHNSMMLIPQRTLDDWIREHTARR